MGPTRAEAFSSDADVEPCRLRHPTLAHLSPGDGKERMEAVVIDAHPAAGGRPGAGASAG